MTDCKHENITLDDHIEGYHYLESHFYCMNINCNKEFRVSDLIKMGYKLVKADEQDNEISKG